MCGVCKARCGTAHATCEKENVCNISTESKAGKAPIAIFTSRERQNRAGRSGAGLGGGGRGIEKLQLLMVGSRRLGGVTNLESDKHAGKPGDLIGTCVFEKDACKTTRICQARMLSPRIFLHRPRTGPRTAARVSSCLSKAQSPPSRISRRVPVGQLHFSDVISYSNCTFL